VRTHLALAAEARRVAVWVGTRFGGAIEPIVLQDTNNVVIWLRPHAIVAKVGVRPHSAEALAHELAVARFLAGRGAPVAVPLAEAGLVHHEPTGFVVSLWEHLDFDPTRLSAGRAVGESLRQLHLALRDYDQPLPDFRENLAMTRSALRDDQLMSSLPSVERAFLREAFDRLLAEAEAHAFVEQPLHGEPHQGNYVDTTSGVRWVDFEATCVGPLEWDLASLGEDALTAFPERNEALFSTLRTLNSARVSTWCWARSAIPEMREHAEIHLRLVHERTP
jgi:Ser/Thr protein kinase RdoA (MazF antagonist)